MTSARVGKPFLRSEDLHRGASHSALLQNSWPRADGFVGVERRPYKRGDRSSYTPVSIKAARLFCDDLVEQKVTGWLCKAQVTVVVAGDVVQHSLPRDGMVLTAMLP